MVRSGLTMGNEPTDALRRAQERLDEASGRLMDEARAASQAKPPPSGWQSSNGESAAGSLGAELEAVLTAVRSLRDLIPPEVVQRLADALRELLMALRALIDAYIERLERSTPQSPHVEDIPIE